MPTVTTTSATATPATATPPAGTSAGGARVGRLRNGELRGMVAGFLVGNSGEFTAGQIGRALGRSSGAVSNALVTLEGSGHAAQTSARPLRYTATATTHSAAAAPATAPTTAPTAAPTTASAAGSSAGRGSGSRGGRSSGATTSGAPRKTAIPPAVTAGGAGSAGGEVVSGPVVRPNGSLYHPRVVAGLPDVADVTALRRLREAGVAALLYGPPGTGKTSVVEAAFPDLLTVAGDSDTTVADLVGEYTQTPQGRYVFVEGPLVRAMREGRALFIDDATLISPTVLAVMYPAMDGRREVVVKANAGQVVTAAEGFYVVAGHNPGAHGAVLSGALSSRFSAQIRVSTDYDLARQLGIDPRAVRAARNLATRVESGEIGWAPELRELLAFQKISGVLGVEAAAGNLIGVAPEEDRDTVSSVLRSAFGDQIAPLALGPQLTPTPTPAPATSPPSASSPATPAPGSAPAPAIASGPTTPTARPARASSGPASSGPASS